MGNSVVQKPVVLFYIALYRKCCNMICSQFSTIYYAHSFHEQPGTWPRQRLPAIVGPPSCFQMQRLKQTVGPSSGFTIVYDFCTIPYLIVYCTIVGYIELTYKI